MIGNPQPSTPRERLAWEIRTVADRFRTLSPQRLARPMGTYESRATAGREVAQHLADAAAGVAGRDGETAAFVRTIPTVAGFAVGEQISVAGNDLVAELALVPDEVQVWHSTDRVSVADLITTMIEELRTLRLAL